MTHYYSRIIISSEEMKLILQNDYNIYVPHTQHNLNNIETWFILYYILFFENLDNSSALQM